MRSLRRRLIVQQREVPPVVVNDLVQHSIAVVDATCDEGRSVDKSVQSTGWQCADRGIERSY